MRLRTPVAGQGGRQLGFVALAAVLALCTPGRSSAQTSTAEAPGLSAKSAAAQVLRPGDIIRLSIWRAEDLSGDYPVDETGMAVFPLIGPLRVVDMQPDSLKRHLTRAYAKYLQHPAIDVILLRRINILGSVRNPGLYPVDPTMTITDALALAGGPTPVGDSEEIELIRGGETLETSLSERTRMGELGIRSGDQLYVPERSWLSQNTRIVTAAIAASISLLIAFTR